jgi:glutathionyl-hydroquinone reductase
MTLEQRIVKSLLEAKKNDFEDVATGVCAWVNYDTDYQAKMLLEEAFKHWPRYSGISTFPVSSKRKNFRMTTKEIGTEYDEITLELFRLYNSTTNKYSRTTQYGRNRRNLVNFLIKYFNDQN